MKYRIREELSEDGTTLYIPQRKVLGLFWQDYFWWGVRSSKTGCCFFSNAEAANQAIADHKKFLASMRTKQKRYIEVSQ